VGHAGEREHVMLAQGVERDVPGQHELVVTLVVRERRQVERPRRQQLGIGSGNPAGCVADVLVARILAERGQ
jgi:hypothetical protein